MSAFHLVEHGTSVDISRSDSECGVSPTSKDPASAPATSLSWKPLLLLLLLLCVVAVGALSTVLPSTQMGLRARGREVNGAGPIAGHPRHHHGPHRHGDPPGAKGPRAGNASAWHSEAVVSIQQACASEMAAHCPTAHRHGRVECLLQRYYADTAVAVSLSPTCRRWLDAREDCAAFLRTSGRHAHCRSTGHPRGHHLRECLRHTDPALLPPTCAESEYYASVQLFGRLRGERAKAHGHRHHQKRHHVNDSKP